MNRSKIKGNGFERRIVREASESGLDAYRQFLSRSPLNDKWDICIQGKGFQCKKMKKGLKTLYKFIEGTDGAIVCEDYKEPLIIMRFKDWLNDFRQIHNVHT